MKLDLLTNATVVDDAIRFVSSQQEEKAKANRRNENRTGIYVDGNNQEIFDLEV
jgi:hypothetical protein